MSHVKRFNIPLLLVAIFTALGASKCAHIPIDRSEAAVVAHDDTIQFQGAGMKSQRGYLFFQKREGTLPDEELSLIVPKLNCKYDSCARFQFFRKDGSPGYAAGIPKGETFAKLNMSQILGHSLPVLPGDDGEYSAVIQLIYQGEDGQEHGVMMNGFVRVNVISKGYDPVGCNDPATAWKVKAGPDCEVQFTTAGRSAACGGGC